jgi:hypothetical protein
MSKIKVTYSNGDTKIVNYKVPVTDTVDDFATRISWIHDVSKVEILERGNDEE